MNIAQVFPHKNLVTLTPQDTAGPDGPIEQDPITVERAYIDETDTLVRDATGAERVSTATVYMPLKYWAAAGTKVTIWVGTDQERDSTAISAQRLTFDKRTPNHAALHLE